MTTAATAQTKPKLSAWDMFFHDPALAAQELEAAIVERRVLDTPPEGTPRLQAAAAKYLMTQVAAQILAVLQRLPMADMLTGGWQELQKVAQARTATKLDGSSRNVSLLLHEVNFGHLSTIEMLLNEVPIPILHLAFDAAFAIEACELEIVAGEIGHVTLGPTAVKAALRTNDVTLLDRPVATVNLHHLFGTEEEPSTTEEAGPATTSGNALH